MGQNAEFGTAYALASFNSEAVTPPPAAIIAGFDTGRIAFAFASGAASPASFDIRTAQRSSMLSATGSANMELTAGSTPESRLRVLYNAATPGADDPAFQFRYVSYAIWTEAAGFETFNSAHVFGFATKAGTVPTSGTRTLAGIVRGRRVTARSGGVATTFNLAGNATVTVDFGARRARVQADIPELALTLDNSFEINESGRFEGGIGGTSGAPAGSVRGGLFGPGAEEAALAFTLSRTDPALQEEQRIVGAIVAK